MKTKIPKKGVKAKKKSVSKTQKHHHVQRLELVTFGFLLSILAACIVFIITSH